MPVGMPKALSASHSARLRREAEVTGRVETRPVRSSRPTNAPLGSSSKGREEPQDAVGREALHAVIAGQASGHDRGPDGRTLGGPEGGERTRGAAPGQPGERGQGSARDAVLHLVRTQAVDPHQDHAAHGGHRIGGHGDGRGPLLGCRPHARGTARVAAGARTASAAAAARERCGKSRASTPTASITRSDAVTARHEPKRPAQRGNGNRMAVAQEVEPEEQRRWRARPGSESEKSQG